MGSSPSKKVPKSENPKTDKFKNALHESDKKRAQEIVAKNPYFKEEFEHFANTTEILEKKSTDIEDILTHLSEAEHFYFNTTEKRIHKCFGDYLAYIGFAAAGTKMYLEIMEKGPGYVEDQSSSFPLDEYRLLLSIQDVLFNFSDSSVALGERIAKSGILKYLLNNMEFFLVEREKEWNSSSVLESSLGCLYNCARYCSADTRECFRRENCVEKLIPFLKTNALSIKVLVLITLANIVNETENNLLLADAEVFNNLIGLLKRAEGKRDRRYEGFSAEELLEGVKGLAKNDENKLILVKKGILDVLKSVLTTIFDDGEVLEATETLRVLSFANENKIQIKNDVELMKIIQELSESKNEKIVKAASGIVWNLKDDKEKAKVKTKSSGKGHVMISYQWADQKKLIQIQQSLKENGYSVWLDINDMEGSTLEAMADAVEKSSVVLMCMSEKYKESSNCRTEAEYAYTLKKPIIPLMMQLGYKPDGYLGMILGAKLFVDFSGKYSYDDSLNKLIKLLGEDGKLQEIAGDDVDGPIAVVKNVPLQTSKGNSVSQWSKNDVLKWLNKISLDNKTKLHNLSGEHLVFLKKFSNRAPEFFFNYIKTDLGLDQLDDMMKFSNGIDQL